MTFIAVKGKIGSHHHPLTHSWTEVMGSSAQAAGESTHARAVGKGWAQPHMDKGTQQHKQRMQAR